MTCACVPDPDSVYAACGKEGARRVPAEAQYATLLLVKDPEKIISSFFDSIEHQLIKKTLYLTNLRAYKVPFNLIFFPIPIFLNPDFFLKNLHTFPL